MTPVNGLSRGSGARIARTVLFVDLVESVRLMEDDEDGAVRRWRSLMTRVTTDVLPGHDGRLVKQLGDGMMLEFAHAQPAVMAAFAIQRECNRANADQPPSRRMLLRMGAHAGEVISDDYDVYGRDVNLAARLTTLAGPGEIVGSANLRDELTPVLDADVEDLGECYLKHMSRPVRAYRIGPPGPRPVIEPGRSRLPELRPTLAVIPFAARSAEPEHQVIGDVLADEVISALSRTAELNVISRLSTTAFRGRNVSLGDISVHLHADYVLSGAYRATDGRLTLSVELADAHSGRIVWAEALHGDVGAIVSGENELVDRLVANVSAAVMTRELQRAQSQALPTLESYTLLMGAIGLMHRLSAHDFEGARQMLETLTERTPLLAIPHAWLAKWHVLRVQQGWAPDLKREAQLALDRTRRALDADPDCWLALTVDGFVHTNLLKQLDIGQQRYELALRVNPNDSLAWLLKGTLHAFKGEGELAVEGTEHALRLSPLDPHRYFYDSLAATAALSAGRYERAIELAQRSLRANRTHTSTFRALAIAQALLGRLDDARASVVELLKLEPTLTVTRWLERSPTSAYVTGRIWADALRGAGMPE